VKKDEVPQDRARAFEGQKKAVYAVDGEGRYSITGSSGWEAEEIVLDQAITYFARLASQALERVRCGTASPLEYHMYRQRMDLTLLAQSTGFFKWRVRRHLRPAVFARLNAKILERYTGALGLTIQQITQVPDDD
jgi:hypothetical protein